MALQTLRYRSQFVTGLAFLLGYFTVSLSENSVYSLSAGVFLAIGLVSIVLKMGWFELEVFGILSTYLTHLYWLYRLLGVNGAGGSAFPEYHASLTILFVYWLIFRFSYIKRSIKSDFEEHVSAAAAVLNIMLLLGCTARDCSPMFANQVVESPISMKRDLPELFDADLFLREFARIDFTKENPGPALTAKEHIGNPGANRAGHLQVSTHEPSGYLLVLKALQRR